MAAFLPKLTPLALLVAGLGATVARAQTPMITHEAPGAPAVMFSDPVSQVRGGVL